MGKKKKNRKTEIVQVLNDSAQVSTCLPRIKGENYKKENLYLNKKRSRCTGAYQCIFNRIDECEDNEFIRFVKNRFRITDIEYRTILSEAKANFVAFEKHNEEIDERTAELTEIINKKEEGSFEAFVERQRLKKIKGHSITFGGRANAKRLAAQHNKPHHQNEMLVRLDDEYDELRKQLEILKDRNIHAKRRNHKIAVCERKIKKNRNQYQYWLNVDESAEKQIEKTLEQMEKRRFCQFRVMGEANQSGNRFVKFLEFGEGILSIRIKVTGEEEQIFYVKVPKNMTAVVERLCKMASEKEISLTFAFDDDCVVIQNDMMKLNGYAVDEKSRRRDVKEIKSSKKLSDEEKTEKIKNVYIEYNKERDERMLAGKDPDIILSYDYNPGELGFVISGREKDGSLTLLHAEQITWKEHMKPLGVPSDSPKQIRQNNRRKNAIILAFKKMFEDADRYRCSECIREDLEFKTKFDRKFSPKISNRKNVNMWNRELADNLAHKHCAQMGIKDVVINPAYTSFIGNIKYNKLMNDSCAAATEIGRRGINRYKNGSFYPDMTEKDMDTLRSVFANTEDVDLCVDGSVLRKVLENINTSSSWKEVYKSIKDCFKTKSLFERRYRTPIKDATM